MNPFLPILTAFAMSVSAALADEPGVSPPLERSRYLLIERAPETASGDMATADALFKEAGVKPDSELAKLLKTPKIPQWKTFEDEHVRFDYPDFPDVVVSPADQKPAPGTQVYGDPVGSVDRRSSRFYTIGVGKVTWATVMLQDAPRFDDGICFCGAVALRVYVPANGCLNAYDLLEDGQLKKMQILGDGKRVQVFEWTHLPMSQENYLRFTESILLKHPSAKTPAEWMGEYQKTRSDALGWLRPGMKEADVIALLGKPKLREGTTLVYQEADEEKIWLTTIRIPLPAGVFTKLPNDWCKSEEIPPTPGTLRWAHKLTDPNASSVLPNTAEVKPTEAALGLLKKTCLENLKSCGGDGWNEWVQVVDKLHEDGWDEPTLGPLLASRFLDKDVNVNSASILLGKLHPPGTQKLIAKRIRYELGASATPDSLKSRDLNDCFENIHNLLCQMKNEKKRLVFIREAIAHPHHGIRFYGYWWLDKLPPDEKLAAARKGLDDSDGYVRGHAAEAFAKDVGTKEDLQPLKDHAATEKIDSVKKELLKAIKRVEELR